MNFQKLTKPFIIAEMSGNHNQSLERALSIIDAAALAGADALKIQTYTADTMTIDKSDGEFFISDTNSLWKGESLYSLYQKSYTPWEWQPRLMEEANKLGMECFSSPFDFSSVDFLEVPVANAVFMLFCFKNSKSSSAPAINFTTIFFST